MKKLQAIITVLFLGIFTFVSAQTTTTTTNKEKSVEKVVITKNDGTTYQGIILSQDVREVILRTESIGDIAIPKHVIQTIEKLEETDYAEGKYVGKNIFAHRHFLTTNALPMEKGTTYAMLSLFGTTEIHHGLTDNVSVGLVSTWLAAPMLGSVKASFELSDGVSLGVGTLAGWGGPYSGVNDAFIALPYGALTFGNERNNFTVSAGYFGINDRNYNPIDGRSSKSWAGAPMVSLAGNVKVSERTTLMFDSFIYVDNGTSGTVKAFIPGIRIQSKENKNYKAVQLGLGVGSVNGNSFPMPTISWLRRL